MSKNEPRWYCINSIGMATLCSSEDDARLEAANADSLYARHAPHRAVQLVELGAQSPVQQMAEMSESLRCQDWASLSGIDAYVLIQRYAEDWGDAGLAMEAWLAAKRSAITPESGQGGESLAPGITRENGGVPVGVKAMTIWRNRKTGNEGVVEAKDGFARHSDYEYASAFLIPAADAQWAMGHLDSLRNYVGGSSLQSLDCVRSWLNAWRVPATPAQPPVALVPGVLVQSSTLYVLNAKGTNRWWASVQPGHDDHGIRTTDEECEAIARRLAGPPVALVPLTNEQIMRMKPVCADFVSFRAGVRAMEALAAKNGLVLAGLAATPTPAQQAGSEAARHKYELELPDGDQRKAKVFWSERKEVDGETTHSLCISVTAPPAPQPAEPSEVRDAERYRWLRDKADGEIVFDHTMRQDDGGHRFVLNVPFDGRPIENDAECAARMDAAIDAAMAEGEKAAIQAQQAKGTP